MAERLELSERGVALILRGLREAGYLTSRREGRPFYYRVVPDKPMRRESLRHQTVGQLLQLLAEAETARRDESAGSSQAPSLGLGFGSHGRGIASCGGEHHALEAVPAARGYLPHIPGDISGPRPCPARTEDPPRVPPG